MRCALARPSYQPWALCYGNPQKDGKGSFPLFQQEFTSLSFLESCYTLESQNYLNGYCFCKSARLRGKPTVFCDCFLHLSLQSVGEQPSSSHTILVTWVSVSSPRYPVVHSHVAGSYGCSSPQNVVQHGITIIEPHLARIKPPQLMVKSCYINPPFLAGFHPSPLLITMLLYHVLHNAHNSVRVQYAAQGLEPEYN